MYTMNCELSSARRLLQVKTISEENHTVSAVTDNWSLWCYAAKANLALLVTGKARRGRNIDDFKGEDDYWNFYV